MRCGVWVVVGLGVCVAVFGGRNVQVGRGVSVTEGVMVGLVMAVGVSVSLGVLLGKTSRVFATELFIKYTMPKASIISTALTRMTRIKLLIEVDWRLGAMGAAGLIRAAELGLGLLCQFCRKGRQRRAYRPGW